MTYARHVAPFLPVALTCMTLALVPTISAAQSGAAQIDLHLPGVDTPRTLTITDLGALPQSRITTSTVWTEKAHDYDGVMLFDLLAAHGIDPTDRVGYVTVQAVDGYSAQIDFSLISPQAPMLAYLRNGEPMPLRRQGPFWLLFPYDDDPSFRSESIYALSVWQINTIRVSD